MSAFDHDTPAFDDLSQVTQTVDFAWADVDEHVFGVSSDPEFDRCNPSEAESACECQRAVWTWVFPFDHAKGLSLVQVEEFLARCAVACWASVPMLRAAYSPRDAAGRFAVPAATFDRYAQEWANLPGSPMACLCLERVWAWVYQELKDLDGFACRCIAAIWFFRAPLASGYTMTALAGGFGKRKQSIERATRDFKLEFPDLAKHHPHLKHA